MASKQMTLSSPRSRGVSWASLSLANGLRTRTTKSVTARVGCGAMSNECGMAWECKHTVDLLGELRLRPLEHPTVHRAI